MARIYLSQPLVEGLKDAIIGYLVQPIMRNLCGWALGSEPYGNADFLAVNAGNSSDLRIEFGNISLVNANSINPDSTII